MGKRTVEISEWALPLRYAGYLLLVPLASVAIDMALVWRADGPAPIGLIAWAVFLMLASGIAEFCARRMERGPAIGFEIVGGLIFGSFGTAIALIGFAAAEGAIESIAILGFGGAFIAIGVFLIAYVDRQFNSQKAWGKDPNITIIRRRLKPMAKRALWALAGMIAALFLMLDRPDAIFLSVVILIVISVILIIRAGLKH
jgi:hypothetical protein